MNLQEWINEYQRAYSSAGYTFTESTRQLLLSELPEEPTQQQKEKLVEPYLAMVFDIFQKARENKSFGDVGKIEQKFGSTLERNYGVTEGFFISLARSYWTFKLEMDDLRQTHWQLAAYQVLTSVEFELASRFFPTPGPAAMPNWTRKVTQKEFLEKYAPDVDVEEYFRSNPYFASGSKRGGCLGNLLLLAVCVGLTVTILAFLITR